MGLLISKEKDLDLYINTKYIVSIEITRTEVLINQYSGRQFSIWDLDTEKAKRQIELAMLGGLGVLEKMR